MTSIRHRYLISVDDIAFSYQGGCENLMTTELVIWQPQNRKFILWRPQCIQYFVIRSSLDHWFGNDSRKTKIPDFSRRQCIQFITLRVIQKSCDHWLSNMTAVNDFSLRPCVADNAFSNKIDTKFCDNWFGNESRISFFFFSIATDKRYLHADWFNMKVMNSRWWTTWDD